ncbi:P44/Msp2 family outer membrane protein [Hyphococcus sp.]|uniref:P44/Msp2 family outer membrane protein n=1 Tax=Hyphococcus sp. TaxID=2038636 RepID=UPI003CCBB2A0
MKSVLAILAMAAVVLPARASAQDDDAALGSIYARIGGGISFVNDWEQDFTFNPATPNLTLNGQTVALDNGWVAGGALGFDYADGIRTELEYRYASTNIENVTLDTTTGPAPTLSLNDDISGHFLFTNFYFDFGNASPLTPFIGGGVGGAFIENENAQRDAALAYQGRAGVSYEFGGGLMADVEYIYTRTNQFSFGPDLDDLEPGGPAGPNITGDRYEASSVMVSLRKHF